MTESVAIAIDQKPCRDVQLFPHENKTNDHTTAKDKCSFMPQPFTYPYPAISERSGGTSAPEPRSHSITTRTESAQGKIRSCIRMPFANNDAADATKGEKQSGGWGFSIRDHEGQALAAGAGHIPHASDALQTEAEAVLHEINCAEKIGIARIIAEPYAKVVEQALTCSEYDLAEMGTLF
ncbi:hypothetical protein C2845_PM10G14190 [Panicum miliaceum]|uniref:RNase H type-1 domain-containing protein n=1 Tax=Panicum miliaceum TaxID=4540 RepID=A0A3L6PCS2_PANMI|nr:hypothetical protein C2845_PM10G14190 [Panicum miliaceum]